MPKFTVEIREETVYRVEVEAPDDKQAVEKATEDFRQSPNPNRYFSHIDEFSAAVMKGFQNET